jgi:hypothetical protein
MGSDQFRSMPAVRLKRPQPVAKYASDSDPFKRLTYLEVELKLPESWRKFKDKSVVQMGDSVRGWIWID